MHCIGYIGTLMIDFSYIDRLDLEHSIYCNPLVFETVEK